MSERWSELLSNLPDYLGGHMVLSLTALAVGLFISLPLGIVASHRPRLAEWTLSIAGVIQTVPSLALLALMVPLLGGLIGFVPALIALTLYSVLPILANTVIGIRGVDPALTEAAQGLGMSPRQVLTRVELPLAAPTIIAGVRTATVLVVGTATLVTPVGGTSLGNYIFGGLESLNHLATVFGCVLAAVLAVALDQLIRLLEVSARRRDRRLAWLAAAGLLVMIAGSLYAPLARLLAFQPPPAVIAGGPFTEQYVLCELLTQHLDKSGVRADQQTGMSGGISLEALFHSQVDCTVNYSGNIWTLVMKRKDFVDRQTAMEEITSYLREQFGVACLGSLGFEDAYTFAMLKSRARQLGIRSVGDLARYAAKIKRADKRLRIGGDIQFFDRPEWPRIKQAYGLSDQQVRTVAMNPTLMYGAVADGQVDVITAYTSDGRIPAFDLEVLEDDRQAFPPYDAVLLVSPLASKNEELLSALRPLIGSIRLQDMQHANYRMDMEKWTARRSAAELLGRLSAAP